MNHFQDRFVNIRHHDEQRCGQRGQVVCCEGMSIAVRFADGQHETYSVRAVQMDADQTTPVWPPAPTPMADVPIRVGDFVNVMRPDSGGTTRGRVTSQTICAAYHFVDVVYADGSTGALRWDQVTLSTDQTTPLDGGA